MTARTNGCPFVHFHRENNPRYIVHATKICKMSTHTNSSRYEWSSTLIRHAITSPKRKPNTLCCDTAPNTFRLGRVALTVVPLSQAAHRPGARSGTRLPHSCVTARPARAAWVVPRGTYTYAIKGRPVRVIQARQARESVGAISGIACSLKVSKTKKKKSATASPLPPGIYSSLFGYGYKAHPTENETCVTEPGRRTSPHSRED